MRRSDIAIGETAEPRASSALPYAALVFGALAMGATPIFVRLAEIGPVSSAFWRIAAALPALWAWQALEAAALRRKGAEPAGVTPAVALAGVFFAGDLLFLHLAIANTTIANATFFATTSPIFVVVAAAVLFGERASAGTLLGIALALAGGAALMAESFDVDPARLDGDLYGVLSAIAFGAYLMAVGRARGAHGTGRLLYLSSLVSAALLLPAALALEDRLLPSGLTGVAAIAALGLISHSGGQGLLAYALGHLSPTFSSLVIFLSAIAASALGWLVLGERLSAIQIAGGFVILLGIYAARPRAPHPETAP